MLSTGRSLPALRRGRMKRPVDASDLIHHGSRVRLPDTALLKRRIMSSRYDVTSLIKDMDEFQPLLNESGLSEVELAYQFLKTLAAVGRDVPETLYKVYASGVAISKTTLYAVSSYFEGAGLINIVCDCYDGGGLCEKPNHFNNQAYDNGLGHLRTEDSGYASIIKQIGNIQDLYR